MLSQLFASLANTELWIAAWLPLPSDGLGQYCQIRKLQINLFLVAYNSVALKKWFNLYIFLSNNLQYLIFLQLLLLYHRSSLNITLVPVVTMIAYISAIPSKLLRILLLSFILNKMLLYPLQARRHGGIPRPCLPKSLLVPQKNENCAPPSENRAPKKINRLGATGEQFEAWDSRNTANHPRFREQELFFRRFCNNDRLFFWFHPRIHENLRKFWDEDLFFFFRSLPQISSNFAMNISFFGTHSRIQRNKVFVPLQNLFMPPPPSHAILAPGLIH